MIGWAFLTCGQNGGLIIANQVRGMAWGLRNMVDAAAYLPDSDPVKAYLTTLVQNNLAWFDTYAISNVTPLGTYFVTAQSSFGTSGNGILSNVYVTSPWENNFLAWSIQHANDQGFSGGDQLRNAFVIQQVTLFNSSEWPELYAAPSWLAVGTVGSDGAPVYYTTFAQMFAENFGTPPSHPVGFPGNYGTDSRLALMIGIELGLTGAQAAYNYLDPQVQVDYVHAAGWAISMRP